MFNLYKFALY
ncbi:hypothetical protein Avbf_05045 [Armadillidium vulgare]|nr:hypothetical protein Avbf_05045 [Armadillidium vulgare]